MTDPVPTMKREVRDLWVAALRDTDTYPQTKGALHNSDGYCCLGVLCEVAVKAGVQIDVGPIPGNPDLIHYDGEVEHLPAAVVDWAGLDTNNPVVLVDDEDGEETVQYERELVMLNDDWVWDFPSIANVIEAQL
jgi:hypothetical protein